MESVALRDMLFLAVQAAVKGGNEILEVYASKFEVELKADESPLTLADQRAHNAIAADLAGTGLPILSEEGRSIPYAERKAWGHFWMVDPLDGTKEFVKRNGEFTVNIAMIKEHNPVMGVIYVPVKDILYFSASTIGSFKLDNYKDADSSSLDALIAASDELPKQGLKEKFTVVASRSHMSDETKDFITELEQEHGEVEIASMGSSLKLCLVAEGAADIYPRFAPTMEWDTAAGHAIVLGSGKAVIDHSTGELMKYNKENLLNNWFIVR